MISSSLASLQLESHGWINSVRLCGMAPVEQGLHFDLATAFESWVHFTSVKLHSAITEGFGNSPFKYCLLQQMLGGSAISYDLWPAATHNRQKLGVLCCSGIRIFAGREACHAGKCCPQTFATSPVSHCMCACDEGCRNFRMIASCCWIVCTKRRKRTTIRTDLIRNFWI